MNAQTARLLADYQSLPADYRTAEDEADRAGVLNMADILADALRARGVKVEALTFTAPEPEPDPFAVDMPDMSGIAIAPRVEVTANGPAYLLPGIEPVPVHRGAADQVRMF